MKADLLKISDEQNEYVKALTHAANKTRAMAILEQNLEDLDKKTQNIRQSISRLERERNVLSENEPDPKNVSATLEHVFKNFQKAEPSVRRNFVREVFDRIEAVSKHEVRAYWRFPETTKPDFSSTCDAGGSGFGSELNWGPNRLDNIKTKTTLLTASCNPT